MRWIGREVKRFLQTADLHLPFLLRIASCPAELTDEIAEELEIDDDGNIGLDEDDEELQPTEEELAAEEELLPDMMQSAECWDNFLALVENIKAPWTEDTDEYRETCAIAAFNLQPRLRVRVLQQLVRAQPIPPIMGPPHHVLRGATADHPPRRPRPP